VKQELQTFGFQAGAWEPAKRRPRYYDKAFLGFAAKWFKGKV
jgi:hypothetical protein